MLELRTGHNQDEFFPFGNMCAIIICCLAALLIRRVDHPRAKVPETWMKSLLYELKEICAKLQAGLALVKGTITGSGEPLRSCKWTTFLSAFSRTGSEAQPTAVLEVNGTHAHVPKQIGDQQVLQTTAGKRKRKAKKAKEAEAILDKEDATAQKNEFREDLDRTVDLTSLVWDRVGLQECSARVSGDVQHGRCLFSTCLPSLPVLQETGCTGCTSVEAAWLMAYTRSVSLLDKSNVKENGGCSSRNDKLNIEPLDAWDPLKSLWDKERGVAAEQGRVILMATSRWLNGDTAMPPRAMASLRFLGPTVAEAQDAKHSTEPKQDKLGGSGKTSKSRVQASGKAHVELPQSNIKVARTFIEVDEGASSLSSRLKKSMSWGDIPMCSHTELRGAFL
ncbi:unnamed protein product [Durusdinium trenchii]|uniref:Uncharacterized protein n=1 Tax=Durusdinium trenchii TaxID=1381693 RepID=A0ABP0K6Y2_9DINO